MLACYEDVFPEPVAAYCLCAARALGSRACDHGSAPSAGCLGTVDHTTPILARRSMPVGPVVNGMVTVAGSPHDRATGHRATLAPTWATGLCELAAWTAAARTAGHGTGGACP